MNRLERFSDFSENEKFSQVGFTKNKSSSKGLIVLGVVLFAITTIVGWYMISGPEPLSMSYMMANLFIWGTSLVVILIGINNRHL